MSRKSTLQLNPLTYPLALAGLLLLLAFGLPAVSSAWQNPEGEKDCIPMEQTGNGPPQQSEEDCEDDEKPATAGSSASNTKSDGGGEPKAYNDCEDPMSTGQDDSDDEPPPDPDTKWTSAEENDCPPDELPEPEEDWLPKDPCGDWKDALGGTLEKGSDDGDPLGPDGGNDPVTPEGSTNKDSSSSSYGDTSSSSSSSNGDGQGGLGEDATTEVSGDCGEEDPVDTPPEEEDCANSKDDPNAGSQDGNSQGGEDGDAGPGQSNSGSAAKLVDNPLAVNASDPQQYLEVDWLYGSGFGKSSKAGGSEPTADPESPDPAPDDEPGGDTSDAADPDSGSGDNSEENVSNNPPEDGDPSPTEAPKVDDDCPPEGSYAGGSSGGGNNIVPLAGSGGKSSPPSLDPGSLAKAGKKVGKDGNPEEDPYLALLKDKFGGNGKRKLFVLNLNGVAKKSGPQIVPGPVVPSGVLAAPGDDEDNVIHDFNGRRLFRILEKLGDEDKHISRPELAYLKGSVYGWMEKTVGPNGSETEKVEELQNQVEQIAKRIENFQHVMEKDDDSIVDLHLWNLLSAAQQEKAEREVELAGAEDEWRSLLSIYTRIMELISKRLEALDAPDDSPDGGGGGTPGDPTPVELPGSLEPANDNDIDGDGEPNIDEEGQPLDPDIDGDGIPNQHKHVFILLDTPQRIHRWIYPEDHQGQDPDNDGDGKPNWRDSTPDGPRSELEPLAFYDPRETAKLATGVAPLAERILASRSAALASADPPAPVDDVDPPGDPADEPEREDPGSIIEDVIDIVNFLDDVGSSTWAVAAAVVATIAVSSDTDPIGKGSKIVYNTSEEDRPTATSSKDSDSSGDKDDSTGEHAPEH